MALPWVRTRHVLLSLLFAVSLAACSSAQAAAPPSTTPPPTITATFTFTALPPTPTASPSPTSSSTPERTLTPTPSPTPWPTYTPTYAPTPDADAANRQVRLPILLYHYVEPWPADADALRQGLTVRPENFAAQMQYLHDHGYVTVSLYDLIYALALGWPLPEKAVVLTFDDGYRTLVDYALPAMQPYGYTGTVFVITELMDGEFPQYLTWPQAEGLYARGWKIEPHTKTHDELAGRDWDFQLYQMLGSIQTVQAHIGATPRFFACPSGRCDALTHQLARELHLWGVMTAGFGRVHTFDGRYTFARVRVDGRAALQDFVNALEGDLGR
ncbi:MAG: polysaccharide deacetylase family protein [Anaerolineales bacterium]